MVIPRCYNIYIYYLNILLPKDLKFKFRADHAGSQCRIACERNCHDINITLEKVGIMFLDTRVHHSREYLHSKQCLAKALIAAIENLRDQDYTDYDFRLDVQNNVSLQTADDYLFDGTTDCICPENEIILTLRQMHQEGNTSEALYQAEERLSHAAFVEFTEWLTENKN